MGPDRTRVGRVTRRDAMKGREQNQKTTPPLALPLETVARRAIREMRGRQRIFIRPQARTTLQPATRPARAAGSSAPVGPLCRFWVLGFGPRRGPGFGFGAGPPARARKIDRYTTRQTSEHAWMMNLVGCLSTRDRRPTERTRSLERFRRRCCCELEQPTYKSHSSSNVW